MFAKEMEVVVPQGTVIRAEALRETQRAEGRMVAEDCEPGMTTPPEISASAAAKGQSSLAHTLAL